MLEITLADWLRDLSRPGARKTGGPMPGAADSSAPMRVEGDSPSAAANGDGDRVEISAQGHRLQVEAQVRRAVVAELRLLTSRRPGYGV